MRPALLVRQTGFEGVSRRNEAGWFFLDLKKMP
jgi:hypothetical protein